MSSELWRRFGTTTYEKDQAHFDPKQADCRYCQLSQRHCKGLMAGGAEEGRGEGEGFAQNELSFRLSQ